MSTGTENRSDWPDPAAPKRCLVDDVTRMNTEQVDRVFCVRDVDDIKQVLALARQTGKKVSMRGTRHTMGGQTIAKDGFVIDLLKLKRFSFDPSKEQVVTQPGALWADLIQYLNQFGFSPRTMQSYSSFSVGGSLAVNAHGITTDHCGAESVLSFKIILWDGTEVECSREAPEGASKELFGLALGGYGMFGVIHEITLKVNHNVHLSMEMVQTNVDTFPRIYDEVLADQNNDVEIKLARLDITNLQNIDLFVFRRSSPPGMRTISNLTPAPREMSFTSQLMYKWVMPSFKEMRYALERARGQAIDWGDQNERNLLMYESATPLARLFSPFYEVNDTFVLQELFVPRAQFQAWVTRAAPIYKLAEESCEIDLLNTTVRFVWPDQHQILLSYSQSQDGMYAFVLYYRMHSTAEADEQLHRVHHEFVELTLELGGTFYLPYRHHYTPDQMDRAYPAAKQFFALKQQYDPTEMFVSQWYLQYGRRFWDEALPSPSNTIEALVAPSAFSEPPEVSIRRTDSYKRLLNHPRLRAEFAEQFLTQIFNIENNHILYGMMVQATWDPLNKGEDTLIFQDIQRLLRERDSGALGGANKMWKQVKQLRAQKAELLRETTSIVAHLGRLETLVGYMSIGDNGKMVQLFRKHRLFKGRSWVLHDVDPDQSGAPEMAPVLERGCNHAVGSFVKIDYSRMDPWVQVPDACCDLVTMNQGLHHLPPHKLSDFLSEVRRVLRPSGLFIVREHDCTPELVPMLDLAHSVFNAVTGVSARDELHEIRAFRSVAEWRGIVRGAGFEDSMLYEMEAGDPTVDEMMCFIKPAGSDSPSDGQMGELDLAADAAAPDTSVLPPAVNMILDQLPAGLLDFIKGAIAMLQQSSPDIQAVLERIAGSLSGAQQAYMLQLLPQMFGPLEALLQKLATQLEHVDLKRGALSEALPLEEVLLVVQGLLHKADVGQATVAELAIISAIKEAQAMFGGATESSSGAAGEEEEFKDCSEFPMSRTRSGTDPTPEEVQALLDVVIAKYPEFSQDRVLERAGFPPKTITAVMAKVQGLDRVALATSLADFLDKQAFEEFGEALETLTAGQHHHFSFQSLQQRSSPWWAAAMAVLGSPKVRFTSGGRTMAWLVGLGPVIEMWENAQTLRRQQHAAQLAEGRRFSTKVELSKAESQQLQNAFEALSHNKEQASIMLVEGAQRVVRDIKTLVRATVVMEEGNQQYEVDCSEYLRSRVQNHTLVVDDSVAEHLSTEMGLPRPQKGYRYKPGDMLRGNYKFGGITRGFLGGLSDAVSGPTPDASYTLQLWFETPSVEPEPDVLGPRVQSLLERLQAAGQLRQLHADDGEYTWYKLSEWMQVEILEVFANSLSDEPWFRFPFMKFLALYWKVLAKEAAIVSAKHGARKAFASMAFVTDMIPGVFMAFFFGQLQLLALPLKAYMGTDTYDLDSIVEQFVVKTGFEEPNWPSIDTRIRDCVQVLPRLYTIVVPTFKPMTEIVLKLAQLPELSILQISNQDEVQVRVEVRDDLQMRALKHCSGCTVEFDYQFPRGSTPETPPLSVALCVSVPCLLHVVRCCWENGVDIKQIYDFWC